MVGLSASEIFAAKSSGELLPESYGKWLGGPRKNPLDLYVHPKLA